MARIPISSGFTLIPEGEYVFYITDATYDEKWGRLEVKFVTAQGMTHIERFTLKDSNDEPNEKALNAFSFFAKTALNDFSITEIDHRDLIGHYIRAEIIHTEMPSKKDPTKTVTFARFGDKSPADGFDSVPVSTTVEKPTESAVRKGAVDLDALLD